MIRKLLGRLFRPTAISFAGLNRGQQPNVSIHYGSMLIVSFDLPTQVDIEPVRSAVIGHAFGDSPDLSERN